MVQKGLIAIVFMVVANWRWASLRVGATLAMDERIALPVAAFWKKKLASKCASTRNLVIKG
jgi:hypothetical protein